MAKRKVLSKVFNLLKKKETKQEFILTPKTITNPSGIIQGKDKGDVITTSKAIPVKPGTPSTSSAVKKITSGGTSQILVMPQSSINRTPVFVVNSKTANIVNPKDIKKFNQRLKELRARQQQRVIRPLRPIKTIKNIRDRTLKEKEGTIIYDTSSGVAYYEKGEGKQTIQEKLSRLQGKLETKEATARDKKYLKSFARQSAIFGLSFTTETLSGIKGIMNLPKNTIKAIPKLPRIAVNLVKNRKNIIPMAKLRFRSFRERQGYLLKTSPSSFLGKVGANIFLFKASGKGLQLVGKLGKPATNKISNYLPKFTKKSKVIFSGTQIQKGNKILSVIKFKSGKKIYGFAVGVGKIGKSGKLVLSRVVGRAYKLKSFAYLRKQPLNIKKAVTFASQDIGKTMVVKGVRTLYLKKGVTIQKAIKNIIQVNVGKTAQIYGKRFYKNVVVFPTGQIKRIKLKGITNREFGAISRVFTKKDISIILGQSRTKSKEIINYLGRIKTLKSTDAGKYIISSKGLKQIGKQNLINIASALSTGQVGARKILSKLSPMARKVINNNIKAGLVLIPKINLKNIKAGIPSVSARSMTTSLSGLETPTGKTTTQTLTPQYRQVPRHIDRFQPITNFISRTSTKSVSRSKSVGKQQEKLIEVLKTPTAQREIQKLAPRQKERLRQYLRNYLKFYPKMRVPLVRVIPFGFVVKQKSKVQRATSYRNLKTGWVVYGLNKGAYRRLNSKPLTKIDALSRGAYAIDRTTAKTFKLVPVSNIKSFGRLAKREKGYFTITKPKFREFKIKRGTKYFLQYKLIEKRKYGIDTKTEVKGLSLWKYLSKLKKEGRF
jgi:hypothetical protein